MLHFFRKIRRDLSANSQFFKYLKYAIGEIILVVLGILIALYINNENELKKDRENFDQILVEVENELISNISSVRDALRFYAIHDSIFSYVLIDTFKIEDFNNRTLGATSNAMMSAQFPFVQEESLINLSQTMNLTKEQASILRDLKYLNSYGRLYWEESQEEILIQRRKIHEHYIGFDPFNGDLSDENIINYFQNDPDFKKLARTAFKYQHEYVLDLHRYDLIGREVYSKVHNYLDSIEINPQDSLQFSYDPDDFKHYLGKYQATWCSHKDFVFDDSIAVTLEEDKLIYNAYRSDGPDTNLEIIPIDKFHFRDNRGYGFYHLSFDDQGEVQGIRFSGGGWTYSMKKIR